MTYKISVIIPIYNVEKFIRACLDSIVNQTIGIENIEVIVVNDCTPDNSMEIVYDYAKKYKSIKVIEREFNGGAGATRNTGLKYVTAPYVTFIDSDDFITLNTYEFALNKFNENKCDLFIYEYDYYSESGKVYERNPSYKLFDSDKCIYDITEIPEIIFSMSICNRVFSKKIFDLLKFPTTKFEDITVAISTVFKSDAIYITNKCKYYYRKREESNNKSSTDSYLDNKQSYIDHLNINLKLYDYILEYPNYKEMIDWFNARSYVVFVYNMMNKPFFSENERQVLYQKAKYIFKDIEESSIARIENPISKDIVRIVKSSDFNKYRFNLIKLKIKNRLNLLEKKIKKYNNKLKSSILSISQVIIKISEILLAIFIAIVLKINGPYKDIWLVCERGTDAKDNGYTLFKYIREKYPQKKIYYIIDNKYGYDYEKVKILGNVIQLNSLKHKVYFIMSKNLIAAHKGIIEPWNYIQYKKYISPLLGKKNYIFLQHGITKDDVRDILDKKNADFDLFICGAKPEYEYISNNFGYDKNQVVYTGFSRFDNLYNFTTKKYILLMPTWRNGIISPSFNKKIVIKDEKFLQSKYYQTYQSLINNKELIELLEFYNYNLIFYPHYEVQPYKKYFNSISSRVIIANKNEYDVQKLLKEAKFLITDFSSVYFDFAYMNKPLLYYQFDKEEFYKNHYKKGYFEYENHGFGPVIENENDVINYIEYSFENKFKLEDKYLERINKFFVLKDKDNSKRIYEAIEKL